MSNLWGRVIPSQTFPDPVWIIRATVSGSADKENIVQAGSNQEIRILQGSEAEEFVICLYFVKMTYIDLNWKF